MSKGKQLEDPLFYIYRIEFETGESYVGSHIQYKDIDNYVCSSKYYTRHPELKIKNREILFYLPTLEQMNIMETITIISDKCNSPKNVNGNFGNWLYNFHNNLDCPWNKGIKMDNDFCKKLSDAESEPVICIETMEVLKNAQSNSHISDATRGVRNTVDGKHYRKLTKKEKENILKGNLEETIQLNKNFLIEADYAKPFYYCVENNIAWESIDPVAKMLGESPSLFIERLKTKYKGLTFEIVDSCFIYNNDIKVIRLENPPKNNKKIKCVETGEIFNSVKEANAKYKGHISSALNRNRKTACGYHWEILNEN